MSADPACPRSASHSGAVSTSRIGGVFDEPPLVRVQAGQDLVAQVLRDEPVAASEARRARARDGLVGERECGQRQRRRPALGGAHQCVDLIAVELETGAAQQRRGLAARHRQIALTQLGHERLRRAAARAAPAAPPARRARPRSRRATGRRSRRSRRATPDGAGRERRRGRARCDRRERRRTRCRRPASPPAAASPDRRGRVCSVTQANGRGSLAAHSHSSRRLAEPGGGDEDGQRRRAGTGQLRDEP